MTTPSSHPADNRADLIQNEYADLKQMAAARMQNERFGHTLTGTALANEVAAKMLDAPEVPTGDRGKFLAFANQAMRNYLIDYARGRRRTKRGGDRGKEPLFDVHEMPSDVPAEALALRDALDRLEEYDSRKAEVVQLRFLEGKSVEETAEELETSVATVKRDWIVARAWLAAALKE